MANFQQIEPETAHLREKFSFIGNAGGEYPVKGTDAIRGDKEELIAKVVNIANFALAGCHAGQMAVCDCPVEWSVHGQRIVGHTTRFIDE